GPAVAIVGCGPAVVEVMAVAVEDLNAGREIDDVQAVVGVDGSGARFDEIPFADAALTPDELRLRPRPAAAGQEQQSEREQATSVCAKTGHRVFAFRWKLPASGSASCCQGYQFLAWDARGGDCSRIRKNAGSRPTRILGNAATERSRAGTIPDRCRSPRQLERTA